MPRCLIALGSNLGDRQQMLDRAVERLAEHPHMRLDARSRWHESRPIGGPAGQPPYLNGAITLETSLAPEATLQTLQGIEGDLGRQPSVRWGPRLIDLDLLLYDRLIVSTPMLELPHPRMAWRRFVLRPAAEVAGSMVHPTTGWTIARLLDHLDQAASYVAIAGGIGVGKTQLARGLCRQTSARMIAEPLNLKRLEAFYADPSGTGWEMELEFLDRRAGLIAADLPEWSVDDRLTVSDFWFDQSLAFARVWLPAEQFEAFVRRWNELRGKVVRPKLLVLLDAPVRLLHKRVQSRGRRGEQDLEATQLQRIHHAILAQASRQDQGPVLRLTNDRAFDEVLGEVKAAVEAME